MKLILGCGNLLLQDEGVGVHFVEYLRQQQLPQGVEVLDGGTAGFDLVDFISRAEKVVIVDAVKAGGSPGDIYIFSPEDFQTDSSPQTSLHDISLKDVFQTVKLLGKSPKIKIFGIEPKQIGLGTDLSEQIKEKLPQLCHLVIEEIKKDA